MGKVKKERKKKKKEASDSDEEDDNADDADEKPKKKKADVEDEEDRGMIPGSDSWWSCSHPNMHTCGNLCCCDAETEYDPKVGFCDADEEEPKKAELERIKKLKEEQ